MKFLRTNGFRNKYQMLKSPVYNDCLTEEMRQAFRRHDKEELRQLVISLAQELLDVVSSGKGDELVPECERHPLGGQVSRFHFVAAKLQVACSLYDCSFGGHATCFVTDFINV